MSRLSERIENFNRAYEIYVSAVEEYNNDKTRILSHLALIQAFEVVFELAWKVLKDYLDFQGVKTNYPKDVIKEAFSAGTLTNGQLWIDMLEDRNSTSHEYNTEKVNAILDKIAGIYFEELKDFSEKVKGFDGE